MVAHLVVWYLVFLFSVTLHEYAHARAAAMLGDRTAYFGGYLTLDPTPHLKRSPFGLIFIPILTFIQMGWMMGWASVPYDPVWGKRNPKGQAIMSAAGPLANFLLALVAWTALKVMLAYHVVRIAPRHVHQLFLPVGFGNQSPVAALCLALQIFVDLNVILGLFNLMPAPPLDGAAILEGLAPRRLGPIFDRLRESILLGWAVLIIWWQLFGYVVEPVRSAVFTALLR
jgi:Zn-dependent protease